MSKENLGEKKTMAKKFSMPSIFQKLLISSLSKSQKVDSLTDNGNINLSEPMEDGSFISDRSALSGKG